MLFEDFLDLRNEVVELELLIKGKRTSEVWDAHEKGMSRENEPQERS